MKEYIKKLQSKPEPVRKQILIGSLVVSMSFVFLIWILTLGYRFGGHNNKADDSKSTSNSIKPFELFSQTISDTYSNMSASVANVSNLKNKIKNESTDQEPKVEQGEKQIDLITVDTQNQ